MNSRAKREGGDGAGPAEAGARAGGRRLLVKRVFPFALVLVLAPLLYHGCATFMAAKADEAAPRGPDGVMRGAEARDLGPEDASAAVLLVHGFIGGGNNFNTLPERLAEEGWRVRVMRLPGHGTSPREFAKTTSGELRAAVEEEFHALRGRYAKVFVVGHSMGAALGVLLASEEEVDALVLGAPYFGVTYRWYYVLPAEAWTRLLSPFVRWVYKGESFMMVNKEESKPLIFSYRWIPTRGILTLQEIGREAKKPETLGAIKCPVLWIHAAGDDAASPGEAQRAFERIASADKERLALTRSNHHIFWDYEENEVVEAVVSFLRRQAEQ